MREKSRLKPFAGMVLVGLLALAGTARAATFKAAGREFDTARTVVLPTEDLKPVVVVEFLHHGQIAPDGRNVVVVAKNNELSPVRVLQVGPGDFCRLAFQTLPRQTHYTILYGGQPPEADRLPKWTAKDGLLLETRRWSNCNLRSLESVRAAFESAEPIGAGYVDTVHHAANPFALVPGSFMSRYHGMLHVEKPGQYTFWTSSQDCSFLLVDGQEVVAAPGRHGPQYRARPGSGKTIQLAAGGHEFDYYHVATGGWTMMVAAWAEGREAKGVRPAVIPAQAFRAESIGRAEPSPPSGRKVRVMPDFTATLAGDVPLPDEPAPLVSVTFADKSPKNLVYGTTVAWDFGDGQTSTQANPSHVYLRPGIYPVTLSRRRGGKTVSVTNRVEVDRPFRTHRSKERRHTLDEYLPILAEYDPKRLDAASLRQYALANLWKADLIRVQLEEPAPAKPDSPSEESTGAGRKRPPKRPKRPRPRRETPVEEPAEPPGQTRPTVESMRAFQKKAVEAGRIGLAEGSAVGEVEQWLALARLIGPVARIELEDARLALDVWRAAARRITDPRQQAECYLSAADVAVSDLLDTKLGRSLLEAAQAGLGGQRGASASHLQRAWGDYYALAGDGPAARKAYSEAARLLPAEGKHQEQTAHRGARSRSTEQFLTSQQWARAAEEIHRWQDEFPADKMGGYLSLLYGRYWVGRKKYAQAAAVAESLVAVTPDSPYADQLLLLAAACALQQGQKDRAVAVLGQLLKDYPGSPLVPEVKQKLQQIEQAKDGHEQ